MCDSSLAKGLILGWELLVGKPRLQAEDPECSAGGLRPDGHVGPPYTGLLGCA